MNKLLECASGPCGLLAIFTMGMLCIWLVYWAVKETLHDIFFIFEKSRTRIAAANIAKAPTSALVTFRARDLESYRNDLALEIYETNWRHRGLIERHNHVIDALLAKQYGGGHRGHPAPDRPSGAAPTTHALALRIEPVAPTKTAQITKLGMQK